MTREEFEYAIKSCGCFIYRGQTYYEESELIKTFEDVGLIEQEPKTGHWLFYGRLLKCSNCGYINDDILDECPNCKISMIEPQEVRR